MFTFLPGPFLVQFSGPFYLSTDNKLLKPDSSLKKIKFNDDGKPLYTEQQKSEIHELYVECGVRRLPLVDSWFITAEELKNIYKKFLKLVTN